MRERGILPDRPLQFQVHECIHFGGKLQWELVENIPAESTNHCSYSLFMIDPPLLKIEELIFTYLRSACFMLHTSCRVLYLVDEKPNINIKE